MIHSESLRVGMLTLRANPLRTIRSTLGVLLGLGIAFLAAAIMRMQTQAPVHAAVTFTTVFVAAIASVIVGLTFGLYPALRASRLSPIDAIRHE